MKEEKLIKLIAKQTRTKRYENKERIFDARI